ncbi:hypothetical protein ACX80S_17000 [Arthrobacter sp. RHLT1-20]
MNQDVNPSAAAAVRTAGLLAALTYIDTVGFHGIATNLAGASPKIDRNWSGLIRNAGIAVAATDWPSEIATMAERFTATARQLATALDQHDMTATAAPARVLHVAYHALSDAGWSYLAKIADVPEEDKTSHHHGPGTSQGSS